MVEGGNLLDRDLSASRAMDGRTDDTIGTLSYDIEDLILRACDGPPGEHGGGRTDEEKEVRTDVKPDLAGGRLCLGSGMTVLRRLLGRRSGGLLALRLGLLLSRHGEGRRR